MNEAYKPSVKRFSILLGITILVYLFGISSNRVEHFYAEGFYRVTSVVQRAISGLIPSPIGDFLYLLLVFYILRSIYLFYRKLKAKQLKRTDRLVVPLQALNFLLLLYLTFKILWGLNYSRIPIARQLGIRNEKYNTPELVQLGKYFINKVNELQNITRNDYNINDLKINAKAGYDKLAKKQVFFKYSSPSVKPVLNSWIITRLGTEGYYNPVSGEANLNMRLPAINLPFVTCHEIAHQLGVAREDEANLVGYLVAIHSDDPIFRYSAAYAMLKSILFEIRVKSPEDFDQLFKTINPVTLKDLETDKKFWQAYSGDLSEYFGAIFDRFLKLNDQPKGTNSYQDIVLWLYNIHKKELTP
nr:DUF3810 domain-containing protein [Pedobacter panaciterrae]